MTTETEAAAGMLIAGRRVAAADGKTFNTYNPATGEVIARVAEAGPADVDRAVRAARQAFDSGKWPAFSAAKRGRVLLKAAALIRDRLAALAELETRNGGKTMTDSRGEVLGTAACFEYYAGAAARIMGETIPVSAPGLDLTLREPVGVCAQIIPWNFPIVMAGWKLAPALAAGCTVVLKPAEQTPLIGGLAVDLFHRAGFPTDVVQLAPGDGSVGAALTAHPLLAGVAFTGSTETRARDQSQACRTRRTHHPVYRRDRRPERNDRR